jgi:hypothetical protein
MKGRLVDLIGQSRPVGLSDAVVIPGFDRFTPKLQINRCLVGLLAMDRLDGLLALDTVPSIYISKIFHELRDELLSAMHVAVEREVRAGKPVDVNRLWRTFSRAAAGKMANPVEVSDRCVESERPNVKRGRPNNSRES